MATAGQVIENPAWRAKIVFRETAEDTAGELLRFDFYLGPGGVVAEEHIHPAQEERFEVLSGCLRGRVDKREETAQAGDVKVTVPGIRHIWWNDGDEEAHLVVEFRPALRAEMLFETVFGLATDGKTNNKGLPNFFQRSILLECYPGDFKLARVPELLQRASIRLAAPLARRRGYRAAYPEYSQGTDAHTIK